MVKKSEAIRHKAAASSTSNPSSVTASNESFVSVCNKLWTNYNTTAPKRIKLIDSFMTFLVLSGVFQFAFVLVFGTFPFNAFLGGFGATIGQFVLLAALRMQVTPNNYGQFKSVSPERAFGDFVFGSLMLHFVVYHFIN